MKQMLTKDYCEGMESLYIKWSDLGNRQLNLTVKIWKAHQAEEETIPPDSGPDIT